MAGTGMNPLAGPKETGTTLKPEKACTLILTMIHLSDRTGICKDKNGDWWRIFPDGTKAPK